VNALVNDADLIAQRVLDDTAILTTDELRTLASEYQRVAKDRDEWQAKHDEVFASRETLRKAVEKLDERTS
jgi:hypothetical protein